MNSENNRNTANKNTTPKAAPATEKMISYEQFAGSESCVGCHKNIYDSFDHTVHHFTSAPASEKNIKGNFKPGKNSFAFNYSTTVMMEKRDSGLYQIQYENGVEKKARRFDIVIGSATKGQSYLYWWKQALLQLPITYFTPANQWCNSPGYPGKVAFGRPITSRCLECHSTFVQTISNPNAPSEEFDRNKIIYGVECEKCHGAALQHVQFHKQHPDEKKGKYIVNPALLSRQQNLDLCALCHGGRLNKIKPSFEFTAGDTLSNYFEFNTSADVNSIDVHGNQYGLLTASKCFKMSKMTCTTCHDAHQYEQKKLELFSQRCINCHNSKHGNICKMADTLGLLITKNCIDCHMPKQPSMAIAVLLQGKDIPSVAMLRTHFITVYPGETKKFINNLKTSHKKKS